MKVSLMALAFGILLVAGLPLAATAGPLPGGPDSDSDGVEDAFDNCLNVSNSDQLDNQTRRGAPWTDHDGCGNACTRSADATADGVVGVPDIGQLQQQFGRTDCLVLAQPPCSADFNNDGAVGVPDIGLLQQQFGGSSGPSGLPNEQQGPSCP